MEPRIHQLHQPLPLPKTQLKSQAAASGVSFREILTDAQKLKVSKHAGERLKERNIDISQTQWENIAHKMSEAKQKGITDSLVLLPDAAIVVSTKNSTVITAMDRKEAATKIFSNINGTILMDK
ncbi:flagellar operon protein [Thalassobacillus cyri]|uniref:Flagellar operon protein n=1 Tax=Thalassobacillus cyri TaxID=571932 RepID=A0A1H4G1I6_9BACI|nr:TIGR02530 family flagellar biosynthesis protein [Thalassobacillus cyri]SEB03257.1 flagellar operon protein [Thalassobacillus cyri]